MKTILEAMNNLKENKFDKDKWDKDAERLEKAYKDLYNEYVKSNPENYLDYDDWSNLLPQSKIDEINKKVLSESTIWNTSSVQKLEKGIEEIKEAIPEIKFSKVVDSKFSGPRSRLTLGNLKTNIFIDDNMFIIGDKYQSYTGTIKEVIKYLKKYTK